MFRSCRQQKSLFTSFGVASLVLVIALLTSATAEAQRPLSANEVRVARSLADGVLPMSDLTRAQQRRIFPRFGRINQSRLDEINERLEELFELFFDEDNPFSFAEIQEMLDVEFARLIPETNILIFQETQLLFEPARANRRRLTPAQLLRRARNRRRPAVIAALGSDINVSVAAARGLSLRDVALVLFFDVVRFDLSNLEEPDFFGELVEFYEEFFNSDPDAGALGGVFGNVNTRSLAASTIPRAARFYLRNFGIELAK